MNRRFTLLLSVPLNLLPKTPCLLYGLEAHLPSADRERALQTLRGLNWQRAAYQRLARPLVF
ncbi:MAG: hypothetical protein N0A03_00385 [Anaerolineae bacterium]|nr:hypothetical protein [Anaerolineae bacterium]